MKLKVIDLYLDWPNEVSLFDLRKWVVSRLNEQGEPLRWAITAVEERSTADCCRKLRVEAVLINAQY